MSKAKQALEALETLEKLLLLEGLSESFLKERVAIKDFIINGEHIDTEDSKETARALIATVGENLAYEVADHLYSYRDGDEGYELN